MMVSNHRTSVTKVKKYLYLKHLLMTIAHLTDQSKLGNVAGECSTTQEDKGTTPHTIKICNSYQLGQRRMERTQPIRMKPSFQILKVVPRQIQIKTSLIFL